MLNSGAGAALAAEETAPVLATEAIKLRRGYNLRREPEPLAPDRDGILSVEMEESVRRRSIGSMKPALDLELDTAVV